MIGTSVVKELICSVPTGTHGKESTTSYNNIFGTRRNIARPIKWTNMTGSIIKEVLLILFYSKTGKLTYSKGWLHSNLVEF